MWSWTVLAATMSGRERQLNSEEALLRMESFYLRKGRDQKGFTLLEMLIAVTLIAVALLATASMQGIAINSNSIANRLAVGNLLAQQAAEDLHSLNINDPKLTSASAGNYMLDQINSSNTLTVLGAGVYSATYSTTPNNPVTGTTRIDVSVVYTAHQYTQTQTKTVTYTTYKMVL
jgi:type IV pilus assembly protein PilV